MARKGENIYKRKDGRWEGRYIKSRSSTGKANYGYVYAKSYREVKAKLISQLRKLSLVTSYICYKVHRAWIRCKKSQRNIGSCQREYYNESLCTPIHGFKKRKYATAF